MHPQLQPFALQLFLDFCTIFFPEWPLIFLVSTIHQVILPSPGTLVVISGVGTPHLRLRGKLQQSCPRVPQAEPYRCDSKDIL